MGKSTVCGLLRQAGYPVIDCDDIAHRVVKKVGSLLPLAPNVSPQIA